MGVSNGTNPRKPKSVNNTPVVALAATFDAVVDDITDEDEDEDETDTDADEVEVGCQ